MFGERLKEIRRKKKYTQEEVSKKLGVARTTYSGYETGNAEPDNEVLQKIADLYESSVDYLLGRTNDPKRYNDKEATIHLIEEVASRWGYRVDDPEFLKILSNAFDIIGLAKGKD